MKMNLPNKLTILRIAMVPFFVFFLLADFVPHRYLFALVLFCAASYTDHLDGKIARRDNLITNFGKLMDPLADKILVMSALICLVKLDLASAVCVILIMLREFAVTSVRLLAVEQGRVIAAAKSGKVKTACTMVGIILMLIFPNATLRLVCVAVILVTTIYSGIEYFVKNKDVLAKGTM